MTPPRNTRLKFALSSGVVVVSLLVGLYGCTPEDLVCGGVGTPGIVLTVVDATNRRDLNGEAIVTVRELDPPFLSMTGPPSDAIRITVRPLRYELTVSAPLYVTAYDTATVVQQKARGCEVLVPQIIVVALVRAPSS